MTVGSPVDICVLAGVNNKRRPSRPSPLSHRVGACDGCDDGDGQRLLLWPVHTHVPQAKGVLPGEVPIRGVRAQHLATVRPENKVCRVCGSHPAVWANGLNAASTLACAGLLGTRRVRTWVRTRFAGLHPGQTKNGRRRQLNAGEGLQRIRWLGCRNRPTSEPDSVTVKTSVLAGTCDRGWSKTGQNGEGVQKRDEHRLTHRTQFHVTLYTRARERASREVTTTCVRCVRGAEVLARGSRDLTPLAADHTTLYIRSPVS